MESGRNGHLHRCTVPALSSTPDITITWIRHGQSQWNADGLWQGHTESPLSGLGRRQAEALGRRLRNGEYRFDKVYCSDLGRAQETARIALPEVELTVDARLREIHFGVFEGKNLQKLEALEAHLREELSGWWRSPYDRALSGGGESMADLRARVDAWRAELEGVSRIAVFTHGGVIRDALWRETSPPLEGAWSFLIDNTSLTVITYTAKRNLIERVNDRAHLEQGLE
jgi:broad specificity phosphatase PhoE